MKELKQLSLFLVAYFVFSDGCSTMATSAAVYASVELKMQSSAIIIGILEVSVFAVASCFLWFWLSRRFGIAPKWILITNLTCLGVLPIYALVIRCQWEFYLVAGLFGLQTGSQQAFTRSIFSAIVPRGHEAEFFALFEVFDKGTSWLGPLVISIVFSATGSFKDAFLMLVIFFVLGIALLLPFNAEKAEEEKRAFEAKESAMGAKDELSKA